jgi:hypothetical protein
MLSVIRQEEAERDAHSGNYSEDTVISAQRWQINSSDIEGTSLITEHGEESDQEWRDHFPV